MVVKTGMMIKTRALRRQFPTMLRKPLPSFRTAGEREHCSITGSTVVWCAGLNFCGSSCIYKMCCKLAELVLAWCNPYDNHIVIERRRGD